MTYEEYKTAHSVCPACGSDWVSQTCVGSFPPFPDDNVAKCLSIDCAWEGIVDELAPEPAK